MPEATFPCKCYADRLVAAEDDEFGDIHLSFWTYGQRDGVRLRDRIRWAWKVLRDGTPYADMVVLDLPDAQALGVWLIKTTNKASRPVSVTVDGREASHPVPRGVLEQGPSS